MSTFPKQKPAAKRGPSPAGDWLEQGCFLVVCFQFMEPGLCVHVALSRDGQLADGEEVFTERDESCPLVFGHAQLLLSKLGFDFVNWTGSHFQFGFLLLGQSAALVLHPLVL